MRSLFPIVPAMLLSACQVTSDYKAPEIEMPASFYHSDQRAKSVSSWWRSFKDPTLNHLIESIDTMSLGLQSARKRIRQAEAQVGIAQASLWPLAGANATTQRLRQSDNGLIPVGPGVGATYTDLYQAGLETSWELDLFGKNRRSIEAAVAGAEVAAWDAIDLKLSLQTRLANSYVRYRVIRKQHEITERNLTIRERIVKLARDRRSAGAVTGLDVARSENARDQLRTQLPPLKSAATAELAAMAALLNQSTSSIEQLVGGSSRVPQSRHFLGTGIPSDLLKNRPDVRAAERRLAQAAAQKNVAVASLYPSFSLIGSLGLESISAGDLLQKSSSRFAIGPSMSLPVFQGGRLRSQITAREAGVEAELANYHQAINEVVKEVEVAAINYRQSRKQVTLWDQAVTSAGNARGIARSQYENGSLPLDQYLEVEEAANQSEFERTASRGRAALQIISLSRALGSGWRTR